LGFKTLVKSAWSSFEWTAPRVPKPLNENIEAPGPSPLAVTPPGYPIVATSKIAASL
jgi:hypothetical protein